MAPIPKPTTDKLKVTTLRLIGYWRSATEPDWPDAAAFVDPHWDEQEREMVATYVECGTVARAYLGISRCRICGEENGSLEFTDGVYIWPDGLEHYIRAHSLRLPEPFASHVVERLDALESAAIDQAWWKSQQHDSAGD